MRQFYDEHNVTHFCCNKLVHLSRVCNKDLVARVGCLTRAAFMRARLGSYRERVVRHAVRRGTARSCRT
jgi:hypothetical protein